MPESFRSKISADLHLDCVPFKRQLSGLAATNTRVVELIRARSCAALAIE
jgi:hypothetical protein